MDGHLKISESLAFTIKNRRTIHDFLPACPPDEIILEAINLARWAPNHKLTEPWRFRLIGPETKQLIVDLNADLLRETKGEEAAEHKRKRWSSVPGWLAVSAIRSSDPIREQENYAAVCCAVQNLSLLLWDAGIGMKWTTGPVTRNQKFCEILGLETGDEQLVGLMWYGYPAKTPEMCRSKIEMSLKRLP